MKILLLVHCEEPFRKFFHKMFVPNLVRECRSKQYGKVIHCTSHVESDQPIKQIRPYIDEEIEWSWGYEPESFYFEHDKKFIIHSKSDAHEYTWIPPEFRNGFFRGKNVCLGGGYHSKCLADMESVLEHLNVSYKKLNHIIY